jgi:acetyl/propionyl-CoA carboxylase alpha subunit
MLRDEAHALEEAERIGYPVLIKPSAGGGGKGMRLVRTARELESTFKVSRSEAKAGFGDDALYLEKYLDDNRHVEIQVAVDRFGNAIHMGERDCSVQRRHQKIIEETPSPALTDAARQDLCRAALRAVVAAGYENLGTLEFLVDSKGDAYFIEINCRIQVEHPITELCTGIDMVALQIRIAAGEPLGITQADVVSTRPRHRVPDPGRGSGEGLPAAGRPGRRLPGPGRARRPDGLAPVSRLRNPVLLRLTPRQALRLGSRQDPGDRPRRRRAARAARRRQ